MRTEAVKNGTGVEWSVFDDTGSPYRLEADGKIFDRFDTQAKATEVMREAEDFTRFQAVRDWMETIGCHWSCARTLACNVVESERGRPLDAIPDCHLTCGECLTCQAKGKAGEWSIESSACSAPMTCYDRVKKLWKQAPIGKLAKIAAAMKEAA